MKINKNDSITLFQLVKSDFDSNKKKFKSLSNEDRKIVMAAISHIEGKKFDSTSDSKVQQVISKLISATPPHKTSTKIESFLKGLSNLFFRVSSITIQHSINNIVQKKKECEKKYDSIDNEITAKEISLKVSENGSVKDLQESSEWADGLLPVLQDIHNFFVTHHNQYQNPAQRDSAMQALEKEALKVKENLNKLVNKDVEDNPILRKDIDNLSPQEKKDLNNTYPGVVSNLQFLESVKKLIALHKKNDHVAYVRETEIQVSTYKSNIDNCKELISHAKKGIEIFKKELKEKEAELVKVKDDKDFYDQLFKPVKPLLRGLPRIAPKNEKETGVKPTSNTRDIQPTKPRIQEEEVP